jgi:hypothetical protein
VKRALGLLALAAGCSSGSSQPETTPTPAPRRDAPAAEAPSPSAGRGREIEYAAGDARFLIQRFDTVSVTMPDQSVQRQAFRRSAWVSVRTEEQGSGLRAEVALDSVEVVGAPLPEASLDSARGTRWTARVAEDGEVSDVEASKESAIGDQIGSLIQLLFPRLPGSSIRAGASWTDTTDAPTKADNFDVREQAVMQYVAGAPATRRGTSVLPITATGTFTREGSGTQCMAAVCRTLEMESSGSRRFTWFLGVDGRPAGLDGTETNDVTIMIPDVGQSLEATQSGSIQVTPIPSR